MLLSTCTHKPADCEAKVRPHYSRFSAELNKIAPCF